LQEGAVEAGAYKVSERSAGANLSVDVATTAGRICVQGDTVTHQGLYVVRPHSTTTNLDIATAHATLPRIDQVIVEVKDAAHDGSGLTKAVCRVVTGTATSGATLDNRNGAAALPTSAVRVADVLVPAADTTISNSQIRDRRPWARGAFHIITRTAGDYVRGASTPTQSAVDATNLNPRIECSGAPLRILMTGRMSVNGGGNAQVNFRQDGVLLNALSTVMTINDGKTWSWQGIPAAGSHLFAPWWANSGSASATLEATAANPLVFVVEELVRQVTDNGVV
jgi:hypothetical protein